MTWIFVAVDGGAREALRGMAAHCGTALADVDAPGAMDEGHWTQQFEQSRPALLVSGTSDSAQGRAIEGAARRAARGAGIPIAAIEDFPGNYWDARGGEADVVLVESAAARDVCARKLGPRSPALAVVPPARYDGYRQRLTELRQKTAERWACDPPGRYRVLWAGQPETDDCMRTLAALLPALAAKDHELLFKAHPRDTGYLSGAYAARLSGAGITWTDVTPQSVEDALALAPHAVVTQFSSVAIEAGFFGIPSVWILLPGAGRDRLQAKKGYAEPPLCTAGGALLVTNDMEVTDALKLVLTNSHRKANLTACFDSYFEVRQPARDDTLNTLAEWGQIAK